MSLSEYCLIGIFYRRFVLQLLHEMNLWYEDYIQNVGTLMHCNVQFLLGGFNYGCL